MQAEKRRAEITSAREREELEERRARAHARGLREKYEMRRRTHACNAFQPGYRFLILRAISPLITRAN